MAKPIRALELHYPMIHLKQLTNGGAYIRGGLYIFVRGFRRAYKRRDLYPRVFIHLRKAFGVGELVNGGSYIQRGLYIFIRSFRGAYKRSGLYPRGLIIGIEL